MQRPGLIAINDNNPPGSHPKFITRLRMNGRELTTLDRQRTHDLIESLNFILAQDSSDTRATDLRDSLTHILEMNSRESLSAYHKRMMESRYPKGESQ